MTLIKNLIKTAVVSLLIGLLTLSGFSQKTDDMTQVKRVMWEPVNISERNLFYGPGGQQMLTDLKNPQYIGRQEGGTSLKYRFRDNTGREWVAKIGRETQSETAAVRILWALGYKTEINYLVRSLSVPKIGNYKNVRFEARPENIKRLDSWRWADNPFVGTNEFEGLKLMMAMFNNWDIKDENTAILKDGEAHHYIISDLGATFGKLPETGGGKSGRTVNKPDQYAGSKFIKEVRDGMIDLDYRGKPDNVIGTFKVEHARWLADLLLQLSDKQIEDAFRAANYDDENIKLLAQAFKARIIELDEATKPANTADTNESKGGN
jgi:hypothetical protein